MDGAAECTLLAKEVGVKDKTGKLFSSVTHILTAMVGAGVLAMPRAMGNLGWVAGGFTILLIYFISLLAAKLLTSVFEVNGVQHPRYYEAVGHILGKKWQRAAAVCQLTNLFLVTIAYNITAAISMQSIANLSCGVLLPDGTYARGDGCFNEKWKMTAIFGGAQAVIVQLGNLEESEWLSAVGAGTSIVYCSIALGLSIAKVASGHHYGRVGGIEYPSHAAKAFNVLNALGTISFGYSFSQVLLEIQDTIREPPKSEVTMQRACYIGLSIGGSFYGAVSTFGYLGLGSAVPDDILTAFDSPKWLIITAHCLVVLHMVAAYNVFAQTFFLTLEGYIARLLGVRHPAEEAALQAAAAVITPEHDALKVEGGLEKERGEEKLSGSSTTISEAKEKGEGKLPENLISPFDTAASFPSPGMELEGRHSGVSMHSGQSRKLPVGALSAKSLRHRAIQGIASGEMWGVYTTPNELHTERSAEVLYTIASLKDQRVSYIAGPYRMASGLRSQDIHATTAGAAAGAPAAGTGRRSLRHVLLSVGIRISYVAVITVIAVAVPFFSQISGLIGGLIFWPLTIFFPFTMYIKVYKPGHRMVVLLYVIMAFMLAVAMGATIGSFRNIITSWKTFCFAC